MLDVLCEHTEWVQEDINGNKYKFSGWQLKVVHDDGTIETQWYYPQQRDRESWHAIKRYGGKFVCRCGDGRANFVFKTKERGLAFVDEWLMPRLIPRAMAGEKIHAGRHDVYGL